MSDIGRWNVTTERDREADRTGIGREDLLRTLRHLKARGDDRATISYVSEGSPWTVADVALTETLIAALPIGGGTA